MKKFIFVGFFVFNTFFAFSQRVGFIASDIIRDKFPEAKQAEQRIRSVVEEWKRELEDIDKRIENLKFEISKNRLIWTDEEKRQKEKELEDLITQKLTYSRKKFEPGGEYDMIVKTIMQPIEDKIYAAVQKVAAENGFDIIWDKSTNPLAYVNYKYDLTLKVLRELGVDVSQMEKELQEKIAKDPRNQIKTETPSTLRKKQRTTKKELEPKKEKEQPEEIPKQEPEEEERK
ncbi:MAG: OmpH family outer membrane protein [Ignavibacteria bacterium]|nr:OmpH family outer membrane protein [Ignavibacteria bacterium]